MKNSHQLASRFKEIMLNGTWVANTNYKDQLSDLNWKIVTTKFRSLNSISDLAQHIHYYINGINNVFHGGNLELRDKDSFDFSTIQSQEQWDLFLEKLWKEAEEFTYHIEQLPEERLNQIFVDERYGTWQRNIDGLIEHCYYHLGQIVLIRKILLDQK
jgi:uncharacterized damage-inducible protein DinB